MDQIPKITIVNQGGVVIAVFSDGNILYRIVDLDIKEGEVPEFNSQDVEAPAHQHIQMIYE